MRIRCALGALLVIGAGLAVSTAPLSAQEVRIRDLTIQESAVPLRLMGYGIVVGLDGTGDRATGGRGAGHTVQSVANLLRRFDVEVPAEMMRTRNVAAVLVTAEVSPYLRAGGRFEVHVSSLGDARSIRGGVLWMTPLVADVGGEAVASAQGPLLVSDGGMGRGSYVVETTARLPAGGILERPLPSPAFAAASRLLLKEPDLASAAAIANLINAQVGGGTAAVEDPGSIALNLPDDLGARAASLVQIGELALVAPERPRLIVDSRDGTVVVGGTVQVGSAVVSHGALTLAIGGAAGGDPQFGDVRMPAGTTAQDVASALQAVQTPPVEIAAIFEALREVGALGVEVVVR